MMSSSICVFRGTKYTPQMLKQIQDRRIRRLVKEYVNRGFRCLTNKEFHAGVDILVFNADWRLCEAVESANYATTSTMHPNTVKRYLRAFSKFRGIYKKLVISFKHNISKKQWQTFVTHGIHIRVEGFQD